MSRFSKAIIVLLVLIGTAYYWLMVNAGPEDAPVHGFDLAAIRKQADVVPGPKPLALEYTTIATRHVPGAALAAGTGFRQVLTGVMVWHLVTPQGGIVIDSGLSQADAKNLKFKNFDVRATATVSGWLDTAQLILFTHEHIDHVGGFLEHGNFEAVADKAIITPAQARGMTSLWRKNVGQLPPPRELAAIDAVAPGVVLIQTPGHTPGSQMIFVRLQNGREYLFTGDTGSMASNIIQSVPRSRLLTDWLVQEDRLATIGWLKGLSLLREKAPSLVIIPSHDPGFLEATAAKDGFMLAGGQRSASSAR